MSEPTPSPSVMLSFWLILLIAIGSYSCVVMRMHP